MILNSEEVKAIYGYWPSFHDAEILSIKFTRGSPTKERVAAVSIELNYWETKTINEGTLAFDFVLDKNNVITIEFSDLVDSSVSGFNFQNVIDELLIAKVPEGVSAKFISIYGAEVNILCGSVSVLSVRPYA